ncbi:hypothetical protein [Polaromonas sp. YR568]|uniref:hypothetical protein n=1 Tax=Polaromonas sp. YR568 TaxID=1855301 RepID=UPI00398C21F2
MNTLREVIKETLALADIGVIRGVIAELSVDIDGGAAFLYKINSILDGVVGTATKNRG